MNISGNPTDTLAPAAKPSTNPLQLLELLALLGSFVGTAAAFVTNQAVVAAAPISASLLLNLLNRRNLEKLTLQNSQTTAAQMQLVNEQVHHLQSQIPLGLISPSAELTPDLRPELDAAVAAMNGAVENLSQRLTQLEAIPPVTGFHLDSRPSDDQPSDDQPSALFNADQFNLEFEQQFEQRIDPLEQKIAALAASIQQTSVAPVAAEADPSVVEMLKLQMQVQYTDLQASVNHVLEQLQQLPPATNLEQWAATLTTLTHDVEAYQQRLANLEARPAPGQPEEDVTDVRMDASTVSRHVQSLLYPLEEKIQQLEAHASVQAAQALPDAETEELRQLATQLEASLGGLSTKLDHVSAAAALVTQPTPQAVDLSGFQQHLKSLELKLDMDLARFEEELKQVAQASQSQPSQPNFSPTYPDPSESLDDLNSLDDLLRELETR